MEADELQKKMSDLCDLNADLQVGPILVLVFFQQQHSTL